MLLLLAALQVGCAAETVVYHDVPEWQIREGFISQREWVDAEGVRHVYRPRRIAGERRVADESPNGDPVAATDEHGREVMRALMPEQVIRRLLQCLVDEDYEFLWEEILASRTREEYEREGGGYAEFSAFFERNRDDLFAMLNRMSIELRGPAVQIEVGRMNSQRLRFHPHFARDFKFSTVDLVWEANSLRLLMIHPTLE